MTNEIKFRADLDKRTRESLHKVESRESALLKIDKKMSDALLLAANSMTSPDLTALNDERSAIWNDLRDAKQALAEVTAEKKKILEDAGIDWREMRIGLNELPATEQEYNIRLAGIREPVRSEMMAKMMSTGLLKPYVYVPPPRWGWAGG
jgi:predicted  nucleic acid-binding Zn-ribbon protein